MISSHRVFWKKNDLQNDNEWSEKAAKSFSVPHTWRRLGASSNVRHTGDVVDADPFSFFSGQGVADRGEPWHCVAGLHVDHRFVDRDG